MTTTHHASGAARTRDHSEAYGVLARLFHWLSALLVALLVPLGLVMTALDPGKVQDTLFVTHESLGLTLFAVVLARLVWRLVSPPPPASRDLSRLEIVASGSVHWLLYALLVAMPVSGYLMVVAGGDPLTYFGLAQAPRLVAANHRLSDFFMTVHVTLQYAIYALVLAHAGAALHHHYGRGNDVLARMIPGLRQRRS